MATLGRKGQISLPRAVLARLGLQGGEMLLVDVTSDGAILLRPAGIYPIEVYSDERVRELLEDDRLSPEESARLGSRRGA